MGPGCASQIRAGNRAQGFMRWRQFEDPQAGSELCFTHSSIVLTGLLLKGSKSLPELSFIKMAKMERNAFPDKSAYLGLALSLYPCLLESAPIGKEMKKGEVRAGTRLMPQALALC